MQGLSSWLQVFNPLLLRLHGESSLSLLCSHCSCGSALVLALPLCVGHCQASVPHQDRRGLKQWLIRAHLLTQSWEREGYSSNNWNVGCACSYRGWHDVATAWGTPCVLLGKLAMDRGTLAVKCCSGFWGGVWVVTFACTYDSWWQGGCGSGPHLPLGSEMIAAAHTCLWTSLRWCSVICGQQSRKPLSLHTPKQ